MAIGDYTKTVYIDGISHTVPTNPGDPKINAVDLNNNENKVDELDTELFADEADISTLQTDLDVAEVAIDFLELLGGGSIIGLQVTTGADTDHDVNISTGYCMDSSGVYKLTGTAMIKQIDAAWDTGTNKGGLFSGSVGANTVYYFFIIRKDSNGSIDYGWDTSATAANKPAGYTYYRKLRNCLTDSSSNLYYLNVILDESIYLRHKFSPMVAYTPTFTGFGTPSSVSFFWCRSGNMIKIIGKFTAGTTTATEARITLPLTYISDTTFIPSIMYCGSISSNANGEVFITCLIENGLNYMTFGDQSSTTNGLTKYNGNAVCVTGTVWSLHAEIPIQGWN